MDLRVYHSEGGGHATLRAQGLHWRLTAVSEDDGGLLSHKSGWVPGSDVHMDARGLAR